MPASLQLLPGVPTDRRFHQQGARSTYRHQIAGITPERIKSYRRQAEQGNTEQLADLFEYLLNNDAHARSVNDTLLRSVSSAELDVEPGTHAAGEEQLAYEAAEFLRDIFARIPQFEQARLHLVHGDGVGWSGAEQVFFQQSNWWIPRLYPIPPRDIRFANDWSAEIRSFKANGRSSRLTERWFSSSKDPVRWVIHTPGAIGTIPTLSGRLLSIVWAWHFKTWAIIFEQEGLERYAGPLAAGTLGTDTSAIARGNMEDGLKNLSANQYVILEEGQKVEFIQANKSPGDSWGPAIDRYNAEISKGILGSTLNTEIGHAGGNRAAAESQAEQTILPRQRDIASALCETLSEQVARPALRFNRREFGGRIPPLPCIKLKLEADPVPVIDDLVIDVGAATNNEVRQRARLPEWSGERGNQIARRMIKGGMGSTQISAPVEETELP